VVGRYIFFFNMPNAISSGRCIFFHEVSLRASKERAGILQRILVMFYKCSMAREPVTSCPLVRVTDLNALGSP
jgi:hypothetical protein